MEWFISDWLLTNNPPPSPEKHAPAFITFVILLFGPACTGDSTCRGGGFKASWAAPVETLVAHLSPNSLAIALRPPHGRGRMLRRVRQKHYSQSVQCIRWGQSSYPRRPQRNPPYRPGQDDDEDVDDDEDAQQIVD